MKSGLLSSRFLSPEESEWQEFIEGRGALFDSATESDTQAATKALTDLQQANRNSGLLVRLRSYDLNAPLLHPRQLICRLPILYTLRGDSYNQSTTLRSARRMSRRNAKVAAPALSESVYVSFWPPETTPRPTFPFAAPRDSDELKCQPVTMALLTPTGDILLSLSTPLRPCRVERLISMEAVSKVRLGLGERLGLNASVLIKMAEGGGTGLSEVCIAAEGDPLNEDLATTTRWNRVRQSVCKLLRRPSLLEACQYKEEQPRMAAQISMVAPVADEEVEPPPMQEPTALCRLRSVSAEPPPARDSAAEKDGRPRTAHAAKGSETWQRLRSVLKVHDTCMVTYCGADTLKLIETLMEDECDEARVVQIFMADVEAPLFVVTSDAAQTSRVLQMLTLSYMFKCHSILPVELAGGVLEKSDQQGLNAGQHPTLLSRLGTRRKTTMAAARLRITRQGSEPLPDTR